MLKTLVPIKTTRQHLGNVAHCLCTSGNDSQLSTTLRTVGRINQIAIKDPMALRRQVIGIVQKDNLNKWVTNPAKFTVKLIDTMERVCEVVRAQIQPSIALSDLLSLHTNCPNGQFFLIKDVPFYGPDEVVFAESVMLGFARLLKMMPFSNLSEHKDALGSRLFHYIKPKRGAEFSKTAFSSNQELSIHVENTFDENRADYQALYCITADPKAQTLFYSVDKLFELAPAALKEKLETIGRAEEFLFTVPESFCAGKPTVGPLFYDLPDGSVATRLCTVTGSAATQRAADLMKDLMDFFQTDQGKASGLSLKNGEMALFSNHTILHGRSAYSATYDDGQLRFLVRMFLSKTAEVPEIRP